MHINKIVFFSALSISLAGCSNPNTADNANFSKAVKTYFQKKPELTAACIPLAFVEQFPAKIATSDAFSKNTLMQLEALTQAGLLTESNTTLPVSAIGLGQSHTESAKEFTLTDLGKKYIIIGTDFFDSSPNLCFATPKLKDITNFTTPADAMGYRVSQVSYEYNLTDIPSWAASSLVQKAFPQIAQSLNKTISGNSTFVLTHQGWQNEKLVN